MHRSGTGVDGPTKGCCAVVDPVGDVVDPLSPLVEKLEQRRVVLDRSHQLNVRIGHLEEGLLDATDDLSVDHLDTQGVDVPLNRGLQVPNRDTDMVNFGEVHNDKARVACDYMQRCTSRPATDGRRHHPAREGVIVANRTIRPEVEVDRINKGQLFCHWNDTADWVEFADHKLRYKAVDFGSEGEESRALLIQYQPGHEIPVHYHPTDYCSIVVEGSIEVTRKLHEVGSIRFVKAGTAYGPARVGADGCTVLDIFAAGSRDITYIEK
jgi:mannose-6-phosphate isomerase-like protein (cupin superfamily)